MLYTKPFISASYLEVWHSLIELVVRVQSRPTFKPLSIRLRLRQANRRLERDLWTSFILFPNSFYFTTWPSTNLLLGNSFSENMFDLFPRFVVSPEVWKECSTLEYINRKVHTNILRKIMFTTYFSLLSRIPTPIVR